MRKIKIPSQQNLVIDVPDGTALLDAFAEHPAPIFWGCRTGLCGVCRVEVIPSLPELLPAPTKEELEVLSLFDSTPRSRLGCQVFVYTDMTVEASLP